MLRHFVTWCACVIQQHVWYALPRIFLAAVVHFLGLILLARFVTTSRVVCQFVNLAYHRLFKVCGVSHVLSDLLLQRASFSYSIRNYKLCRLPMFVIITLIASISLYSHTTIHMSVMTHGYRVVLCLMSEYYDLSQLLLTVNG